MTLPFAESLTVRPPGPRVIPEPPRPGDPGGPQWFVPRPLGMLEASREMLMLWADTLPAATPGQIEAAGRQIGAALTADQPVSVDRRTGSG